MLRPTPLHAEPRQGTHSTVIPCDGFQYSPAGPFHPELHLKQPYLQNQER